MALRTLKLPDDFRGLESLFRTLHNDPDWGLDSTDLDDLLGMFGFMRQLWPPLSAVRWGVRGLRDTLLGFVWTIDNQIVGVVMYDRKLGTRHWQLTLLAVMPAFRHRGIATRLVDAALRDIQARGGDTIRLEVSGESRAAHEFFERMGFEIYNGLYAYDYAHLTPPPAVPLPEDYSVFPLGYYASKPRFELAQRITSPQQARFEPPRLEDFQRNRLWWGLRALSLAVQGVREREVVVHYMLDGSVVGGGGMAIRSRWGDISEIAMRVDPAHSEVIPYLFHHLVTDAQRAGRRRRIEMHCPISQAAVVDYVENNGAERRSTFYKMGIVLRTADANPPAHDFPSIAPGSPDFTS